MTPPNSEAESEKLLGNKWFIEKDYHMAIYHYNIAIVNISACSLLKPEYRSEQTFLLYKQGHLQFEIE